MRIAAVSLAAAVLSSGCLLFEPSVLEPSGPQNAWVNTSADPWMALTTGCGFCIGEPEHPEARTLVLHDGGEVLYFTYGLGATGASRVTAEPALAPWVPAIEEAVRNLSGFHAGSRHLHVHAVATARLAGDEWETLERGLARLEDSVADPGPPRYDCEDCSAPRVELLGAKRLSVALARTDPAHPEYGNYEEGEAWDQLLRQLMAVRDWVEPWAQADAA